MKILFAPAKIKLPLSKKEINKISKQLSKNIAIAYSVQYKDIASKIRKVLEKEHKITKFVQVLGCLKIKFPKQTQEILLISDGKFHAFSLAIEADLPVYVFDGKIKKISEKEIESFKKKKRASYLNFLNARKVGILISLKPGQENLEKALSFKHSKKDKKFYLFLGNEFDVREFENFPEIESWVNTACPRLDMDNNLINISEIRRLGK